MTGVTVATTRAEGSDRGALHAIPATTLAAITRASPAAASARRRGGGAGIAGESRAASTSRKLAKQSSGRFSRQRRIRRSSAAGTPGRRAEGGLGASQSTATRRSSGVSPAKGRAPVIIS